jgi:NarL family two-component system response regulator LiaR
MGAAMLGFLQRKFEVVGRVEKGSDALRLTPELHPDVLVLDVLLPDMDGREVTRELRNQGAKTRIVCVSVPTNPDQISSCLESGADAYVFKARIASDLVPAIQRVLTGASFVSGL